MDSSIRPWDSKQVSHSMSEVQQSRRLSAAWEGIRMALLCMLVSVCGLWIVYQLSERALLLGLRAHLEDLALIVASEMDSEAHRSLEVSAEPGSPLYTQACEPLLRLRKQVPDIYYAYTLAFKDGRPVFVLDSTYFVKNQGDLTEIAMPGEVYKEAPEALWTAWKNKQVASCDQPYTDKWGTFVSAFAPFRDKGGGVCGIVGVDISVKQLALRQKPVRVALQLAAIACLAGSCVVGFLRARSYGRLVQRENELLMARADAERGERAARAGEQAKSVFLATMSHEIRTPLNGVLGMAEALSQTELTPVQREQVQAIRKSGKNLLVMLNDILDFSKIEVGTIAVYSEPVNLSELANDAADLYRASARNKGIDLIVEFSPDAPRHVMADPVRASQILGNLLSNAVKFTARGTVGLQISRAGAMAVLSVRDTGIGIPADRMKDLFMPFSQLDSSLNRRAGGAGLGLAISRRLAELMGGTLTAESHEGIGSCFHFSLPIAEHGPEEMVSAPVSVASAVSGLARLRVLVAEDVAINRQVAEFMLKRHGIVPVFAVDGVEAVAIWREQQPDVILMDVQMPNIDGREATRQIRAESGDPVHPWIIALTGGVTDHEREEAFKAGMNDFLTKPIDMAGIAAALAKVPGLDGTGS